jgi:peroxiredoxin
MTESKKPSKLFAALAAGAFALAIAGTPAYAQNSAPTKEQPKQSDKEHKKDKKDSEHKTMAAKPGDTAPTFTLKDTDGKEHSLASSAGKIVVIEWFNPGCPFIVKQHQVNKTITDLAKTYTAKGVQFYAINSGAPGQQGTGVEANAKAKKDWGLDYPILLDETGATGKSYGAKNTPLMVVIGADGKIAYWGAIDDDSSATTPGKTNYVANALDELLAKKPVTTKETKPYGCNVKYTN